MFEISAITLVSRMPAVVVPPLAVVSPVPVHAATIDIGAVKPLNPIVPRNHSDRDEYQLNQAHSSEQTRHVDRFI